LIVEEGFAEEAALVFVGFAGALGVCTGVVGGLFFGRAAFGGCLVVSLQDREIDRFLYRELRELLQYTYLRLSLRLRFGLGRSLLENQCSWLLRNLVVDELYARFGFGTELK
jgi:hypothetical protein